MYLDRRFLSSFDWVLCALALSVPALGLLVLYSAGYNPDLEIESTWFPELFKSPTFIKQSVYLGLGFATFLTVATIPSIWFQRYAYLAFGVALGLLLLVLLVGTTVNGSQRWLNLGGFNLQPAELFKLSLLLAMSRYLSRNPPKQKGGYRLLELWIPALLLGVPMGLVMKQPDLGTAIIIGSLGAALILFVGVQLKSLLMVFAIAAMTAYPLWHSLHAYQQRRILVLIDPDVDPLGSGYHIIQSKIAVGSGSLFGKGFLRGTQTQLQFLPEHTTDFVFSVLAEEWGFAGCTVVLLVYLLLLIRIARIATRSRDMFGACLAFGVGMQLFLHVFINIGMVVGLFPVVGIPLPLFSYGGSSLVVLFFGIGLVEGVAVRRMERFPK